MLGFSYDADHALLLLGRLDGRLAASPAADIWLARARLQGAATLAQAAGVPIEVRDLQDWIAGRTAPPRHSEGLNDPLSIAALFHFALSAGEDSRDPLNRATLNLSRQILDDRQEAALWGHEDIVRFGPLWREAGQALEAPYPTPSLLAIAERIVATRAALQMPLTEVPLLTTADGRQWRPESSRVDLNWLIACHVPLSLQRAGLALRFLPSFTDMPRLLPGEPALLERMLRENICRRALSGLKDLDRIEARMARAPMDLNVTRRSKAPLLLRLELAYPGLSRTAVARLLGISHQGATKLLAQISGLL
ncbi:hypothetical protein [Sphingobium sp.]|uniref:hypothetical protein n=1 Tax=Sphingobium sp. TaxID=1912891 RepID=UPI0026078BB7|nr:hypothetical protein [Sphingobium sp.]